MRTPWRRIAVVGFVLWLTVGTSPLVVGVLGLPRVAVLILGIAWVAVGVGVLVLLRRRDFEPLHRARRSMEVAVPDAVVVAIALDPLWTPVGAVSEDVVLPVSGGIAIADDTTLSLIDGSGTRLAAPWATISEVRPWRDGLEFVIDGATWAFSMAPFQPRSGARDLRQLGMRALAEEPPSQLPRATSPR